MFSRSMIDKTHTTPPSHPRPRTLGVALASAFFVVSALLAVVVVLPLSLASTKRISAGSNGAITSPGNNNTAGAEQYDNVLFIVMDQLRYDTLGYMQDRLSRYDGYLKVRTPNLDRLVTRGAAFEAAYSQSAVCAPCRATLKTGYTVARHGVATNQLIYESVYNHSQPTIQERIDRIRALEQIMSNDAGYQVETYGKWHFPTGFYAPILSNYYDYNSSRFALDDAVQDFAPPYQRALSALSNVSHVSYATGDQLNHFSGRPYAPLPTDPRYGMPSNTPDDSLPPYLRGLEVGQDTLDANLTSTAILGDMAIRALDRILTDPNRQKQPFFSVGALQRSVCSLQHPPRIAADRYLEYYQARRDQLWVAPSLDDPMLHSAYRHERANANKPGFCENNASFIRDFTSVYYAMIEEVDAHIGRILARLEQDEAAYRRTLVVITSDHGEHMGSHAKTGKNTLLEESTRVPLILVHPSKISEGITVSDPVSHLDVVSTVLDYAGAPPSLDDSDGTSLRRWIERTPFNENYDEGAVVVEYDPRPTQVGTEPNFMIRKGAYKLMMPRLANSSVVDMLYDIETDPYEMNNLLGTAGDDPAVVGKAEHLKILLVEWLERHDTPHRYFTSSSYNLGRGRGDVAEMYSRRTWAALPYWQSDPTVALGAPAPVGFEFGRNEYLYVGGEGLRVSGVAVEGPDAARFGASVDARGPGYARIKVSFRSPDLASAASLSAWLIVNSTATTASIIPIVGQ